MIEKDISNLSRPEMIEKYRKMDEFVVKTELALHLSEKLIKEKGIKEVYSKPLNIVVDLDMNINLLAHESIVYRDLNNRILMITTNKFEVLD